MAIEPELNTELSSSSRTTDASAWLLSRRATDALVLLPSSETDSLVLLLVEALKSLL